MSPARRVDRPFFLTVLALVIIGFFIFSSASLGLLARDGAQFSSVATGQFVIGILGGLAAMLVLARVHYRFFKRFATPLFILALSATLLVFVPGLGFEYGGARRWLDLGITTFQPAELLKLAAVIFFAAWLSKIGPRVSSFKKGMLPFLFFLTPIAAVLLLQPDTDTFIVIVLAVGAMFVAAGARIRDILLLLLIAMIAFGALAMARPYIMDRITTFLDPSADPLGSSYQIQQSLIAIGSGELTGRGFGQSVQKFNYLPEPIGDSIFAVYAEEFGFMGATLLIALLAYFAVRGLKIAANSPDKFGGLVVLGLVILVTAQSFLNIAAMIGLVPLTGLPLIFVSHGGSALLLALIEVGIILNVSRYAKL